jgi:hypothetical protein
MLKEQKLSKEQEVQECDARDDDSSTAAGNKNVFIII